MDRVREDLPEAMPLAAQGNTMAEIARALNVSFWSVQRWARRNDIELPVKRIRGPGDLARAEKMVSMRRQGLTLDKIGQHFGVTRERIRQILKACGVTREEKLNRAGAQREVQLVKMDASALLRWGVPHAEMKRRRADGTIRAFEQQRKSAQYRGIEWNLQFADWLRIWEASGKLALRGRGKDRYVMSRIKNEGGYVLGNVHVQLSTENGSEGIRKCRANKAKNTGVWLMYPGLAKGWMAKVGHTVVGLFATEEDAVAARKQYLIEHPDARFRGRGYAICRNGKTGAVRYQVMVGSRYVGTYRTPEEALAARAQFTGA